MKRHVVFLAAIAFLGLILTSVGIIIHNISSPPSVATLTASLLLSNLGTAILFPILVSYAYDQIRERWLGNEIWRIFSELADGGIIRIYKDREKSDNPENADVHLRKEFQNYNSGEILMIGVTLRVFFNELGTFHREIATMLKKSQGKVKIRALICDKQSAELENRGRVEGRDMAYVIREHDSTVADVIRLNTTNGPMIELRTYLEAPYSTTIIFQDKCHFSPNILSPVVPVGLPMIVFRRGSHGYNRMRESFEYLWRNSKELPTPGNH